MILRAILSLYLCASAGLADFVTLRQQSVPPSPSPGPEQSSSSPSSSTPRQQETPAKPQPSQRKPAAKHPTHRKRPASTANCPASPAPSGTPSQQANQPADPANRQADCPPPKIVVSHGSTAEPGVRLTGNPSKAQATYDRSSTEQLLAATDENLKKVSGQTLAPDRQEMVNQINQFMKQSQAAVASGDTGRGHILARKALLLSEELVKP